MFTKTIFASKVSTDVKNAIKDCLLCFIYRKQDLITFLKSCNFTSQDLRMVTTNLTKSQIIDMSFSNIESRPDKGVVQYKSVIETLIFWSDFDSYWFRNGNLDKDVAIESQNRLKKILSVKTDQDRLKQEEIQRKTQLESIKSKQKTLEDLNERFTVLCKMSENAQKRGIEFEKFLVDLFNLSDIKIDAPFKLKGEQIDGSINLGGNNYILEAKWQDLASANDQLYQFAYKIESNTLYPRGIFISINGYSSEVIDRVTHNKKPQLILVDASDLLFVLEGRVNLSDLLNLKIKHAQTRGEIYINAFKLLEAK